MKKFSLLLLVLVFGVFLSGCNNKVVNNQEGEADFRRPDFGQPEERADLMGIVKSISGNEVIILKLDMPQFKNEKTDTEDAIDEDSDDTAPAFGSISGSEGGGSRMGGGPGMRNKGENTSEENRLSMIKASASGETTIIIPVGIQMLKPIDDSTNMRDIEMIEASLVDIKPDVMVNIWLNSEITDRQIANFVLIK